MEEENGIHSRKQNVAYILRTLISRILNQIYNLKFKKGFAKNTGFCMLNRSLAPGGNTSLVLFYAELGEGEGGGNNSNNTNSIWAPFSFTGER